VRTTQLYTGSQRPYRSISAFTRKPLLHQQVENQSRWGKICTGDIYHPQRDVTLNGLQVLQTEDARYLGLHLDRRLNWRKHIFPERKQFGIQLGKMNWLLGSKSQLSIENILLLYKAILKLIRRLTMGHSFQLEHRNTTKIAKQIPQNHCQCLPMTSQRVIR